MIIMILRMYPWCNQLSQWGLSTWSHHFKTSSTCSFSPPVLHVMHLKVSSYFYSLPTPPLIHPMLFHLPLSLKDWQSFRFFHSWWFWSSQAIWARIREKRWLSSWVRITQANFSLLFETEINNRISSPNTRWHNTWWWSAFPMRFSYSCSPIYWRHYFKFLESCFSRVLQVREAPSLLILS